MKESVCKVKKQRVPSKRFQQKQVTLFLNMLLLLLKNGFGLQESMDIMERSKQLSPLMMQNFQAVLVRGESLAMCFQVIGCTNKEVSQVYFATVHGNVTQTLATIVDQRKRLAKQKQELLKASAYPLALVAMVLFLLIGMNVFFLPQLLMTNMISRDHWGVRFIQYAPISVLLVSCLGGLGYLGTKRTFNNISGIKKATFFCKLPFVGSLYSMYQTSYFSMEWGQLYTQGLESKQLLACMHELPKNTIMYEMAVAMKERFLVGDSFSEMIQTYPFLMPEVAVIIYQGERTGRLGEELLVYSQIVLAQFAERSERLLKWVQPILFCLIACLVISMYAAMLLPMYQNIGGDLF